MIVSIVGISDLRMNGSFSGDSLHIIRDEVSDDHFANCVSGEKFWLYVDDSIDTEYEYFGKDSQCYIFLP